MNTEKCSACGVPTIHYSYMVEFDGEYYCASCAENCGFEYGDGHHVIYL